MTGSELADRLAVIRSMLRGMSEEMKAALKPEIDLAIETTIKEWEAGK